MEYKNHSQSTNGKGEDEKSRVEAKNMGYHRNFPPPPFFWEVGEGGRIWKINCSAHLQAICSLQSRGYLQVVSRTRMAAATSVGVLFLPHCFEILKAFQWSNLQTSKRIKMRKENFPAEHK